MFGEEFNKGRLERGIKQTVKSYGGLKIKATNVFFVSGSTDPWHSLAITGDTAASSKGGWSTLIGRGPSRLSSDWLDHDVADT